MKIGHYKAKPQPFLWPEAGDKAIRVMAQTRNMCGEFFEVATESITGGRRMTTDGTAEYCPDVHVAERVFVESKCVGCTGRMIVYQGRLAKDRRFVDEGNTLHYCIWSHNCRVKGIATEHDLQARLAASICGVMLLPFALVERYALTHPVKLLNSKYNRDGSRNGYGTVEKGYGYGYSMSLKGLAEFVSHVEPVLFMPVGSRWLGSFGCGVVPETLEIVRRSA